MPDIVITSNRGTSNNPKIDFTGVTAGTIKLEVLANGALAWNGANGSLFSISDSLSGSLMSVNDVSGLPAFEVFSDNRVVVGQFGANLLLGKTTNSSNGRLQLTSHTTSTGGIGFGTDNQLFRYNGVQLALTNASGTSGSAIASNVQLRIENGGNGGLQINVPDASTGGIYFGRAADAYYSGIERSTTDLQLRNNGLTALTIASTGAATFAGNLSITGERFRVTNESTVVDVSTTTAAGGFVRSYSNKVSILNAAGTAQGVFSSTGLAVTGAVTVSSTTPSTSAVTGGLQVAGGIGVGAASYFATTLQAGTQLISPNFASPSNGTAITFDNGGTNVGSWSTTRLYVNGNVGIGTSSPGTKLNVEDASVTIRASITSGATTGGAQFEALSNTGNGVLQMGIFATAKASTTFGMANAGLAYLYTTTYSTTMPTGLAIGTYGPQPLVFGTSGLERVRVDASGNVGIGTTSPGGNLDVATAGAASWNRFVVTATSLWGDGGTQYVTIGAGGATGIMIFNPHVVWNAGNAGAAIRMGRSGGVSGGAYYDIGTRASDAWSIQKNGSETGLFYINSAGNVGIGTTSPGTLLQVSGTQAYGLATADLITLKPTLSGGTSSNPSSLGGIYWKDPASTAQGRINVVADNLSGVPDTHMEFWTTNTAGTLAEKMRIDKNGNVGIGTTSPISKLQIGGTSGSLLTVGTLTNNWAGDVAIGISNANGIIVSKINTANDTNRVLVFYRDDTNGATIWGYTPSGGSGNIGFQIRANASSYFNGGNVGIGTTSPASLLDISGNSVQNVGLARFTNNYAAGGIYYPTASFVQTRGNHSYGIVSEFRTNTAGDSDRPSILFYGAQAAHSWQVGPVTSGGWGVSDYFGIGYRASNTPSSFAAWPTNYFTISTGGNVGIGTTSPGALLEIGTNATATTGLIVHGGDGGSGTTIVNFLKNGGGSAAYVRGDGNVGIGTTSPLGTLDIGKGNASPSLVIGNSNYTSQYNSVWGLQGGAQSIMIFGNNGQNEIRAGNTVVGGYLDFYTNNTAAFTVASNGNFAMRLAANGNVGIGTTSPTRKLDVVGAIGVNAGAGNDYILFDYAGTQTWRTRITADNTSSYIIGNDLGGAFNTKILTLTNAGNVGIGTTAPSAKLETSLGGSPAYAGTYPMLYSSGTWPQFPRTLQNVSATITTGGATVGTGPVIGINFENNSATDNVYSPLITFSRKSASGSYNPIYASIGGIATATGSDVNWTAGDLVFGTAAAQGPLERMRITSAGNVGIGTATPISDGLTIRREGGDRKILLKLDRPNTAGLQTALQFTVSDIMVGQIQHEYAASNYNHMSFTLRGVGGANIIPLWLENSGNVGIGTTSPTHKLHLSTGFLATSFGMGYTPSAWARGYGGVIMAGSANSDGTGWSYGGRIVEVDEGDGMNMAFDVNYTNSWTNNAMVISGRAGKQGNVGIGTTSPGYKLDVAGSFKTSGLTVLGGEIYVSPTNSNTLNSGYSGNYTADIWINYRGYNDGLTQFRNFNLGDGKGNNILWADATNRRLSINNSQVASYTLDVNGDVRSANGAYFATSSGNVGIGTTSPGAKFHVAGNAIINDLQINTAVGGGPASTFTFQSNTSSGVNDGFVFNSSRNGGSYGNFEIQKTGTAKVHIGLGSLDPNTYFNIDGNFGIGTTSPSVKLAVVGSATIGSVSNTAAGTNAVSFGEVTTASGNNSFAIGYYSTASNYHSFAAGFQSTASAHTGIAIGYLATAGVNGNTPVAIGRFVTANGENMVIGRGFDASNRLVNTNANSIMMGVNSNLPTIYIGGASGVGTSGDVGIGTTSPAYKLDVSGSIADSIGNIRILPQNSQSAAYTTVLSDSGKHILHPSADTTARTITIDSNANVAYSIGTAITFINQNAAGVLTIAITSDTMRLAGAGTTGSRTLAANGVATAVKITSTEWIISGTGLT